VYHVKIRKDDAPGNLLYEEEKTGELSFNVPDDHDEVVKRIERLIALVVAEGRSLDRAILSDVRDSLEGYRGLAEELEERENQFECAVYDLEMEAARSSGQRREDFSDAAKILRQRLDEGHPLREGFEDEWVSGEIDE